MRLLGFDAAQIAAGRPAIEAHNFSAIIPPKILEAATLRDADRLDALGAMVCVSASMCSTLYHPTDPFAKERKADDRTCALDHWRIKLAGLDVAMLTDGGRAMAVRRCAAMVGFLKSHAADLGYDLPDDWR